MGGRVLAHNISSNLQLGWRNVTTEYRTPQFALSSHFSGPHYPHVYRMITHQSLHVADEKGQSSPKVPTQLVVIGCMAD